MPATTVATQSEPVQPSPLPQNIKQINFLCCTILHLNLPRYFWCNRNKEMEEDMVTYEGKKERNERRKTIDIMIWSLVQGENGSFDTVVCFYQSLNPGLRCQKPTSRLRHTKTQASKERKSCWCRKSGDCAIHVSETLILIFVFLKRTRVSCLYVSRYVSCHPRRRLY